MSRAESVSAKRPYGLERVCRAWKISRSTVYSRRKLLHSGSRAPRKRGPVGAASDDELVKKINEVQKESPWVNEGHRKVWARLRHEKKVYTSRRRVLRLMRENSLLAVVGPRHARGPKNHNGTIIPEAPDRMWGTDATGTLTAEGQTTIFFVIDHATAECRSPRRFSASRWSSTSIRNFGCALTAVRRWSVSARTRPRTSSTSRRFSLSLSTSSRSTPARSARAE